MLVTVTDPRFADHDAGPGHPERPARLGAVEAGLTAGAGPDALRSVAPMAVPASVLARVHSAAHLARFDSLAAVGGGRIDPDTAMSAGSGEAARLAAGAGLAAAAALERGDGTAAFCAVRPPGHHAERDRAMGFCLLNNVAVLAADLRDRGQRVLVLDWDAHHGNGTQDIFWTDPEVCFVSLHQAPLYPGTGRLDERGGGPGQGATVNVPLPAGTTGDVYLAALTEVVEPVVERFRPDWLLISAGFDAHRDDPLTGLGLSAGDFGLLARRVVDWVPSGRIVALLEGGYDLAALKASTAATAAGLLGRHLAPEPPTADGPGAEAVAAARAVHGSA
ncbi:MAG: histone deacetylase family protein [Actinomycetota bacterium]